MSDDGLDRLIAAEQDERRRIALFLHDGPVQNLSGIALMLDAALHAIQTGKLDDARDVLSSALDRQRSTIRELRDLSFALEPVVLRDQGFGPALEALAEQIGTSNQIRIDLDLGDSERIGGTAQVALYTIVRELLDQAVKRGPLTPDRGRHEAPSTAAASRRSSPTTPSRSGAGGRWRGSRSA